MSTALPYESQKINTRELTDQLVNCHGGVFNPLMSDGEISGVICYGPPGIGKTQSVMAAAKEIAEANGMELVVYEPGVRRDPNATRPQCLFMHMSMAGMTSGRIAGFPTVEPAVDKDGKPILDEDGKPRAPRSRQVIPAQWRTAMEFDNVIYLFDEITHVVSQEAMLSLLSEGFYEETKMAKRSLFIATANEGVSDGTLQQKLSTAFRNRLSAYYIRSDVDQWRKDYGNRAVNACALSYAKVYKDRFETFKMPENNLLNLPTLRGLTKLAEDLTYFEAINFRKKKKVMIDGKETYQADPNGEFLDVPVTADHEKMLQRLAYSRLGNENYASDFVNMYTLAHKTVIPQITKAMRNKGEMDPEFIKSLDIDGEAALRSSSNKPGKGDDLKEQQNRIAQVFTFVDYAPRMFLDQMERLNNLPALRERAVEIIKKETGKTLGPDEPVPGSYYQRFAMSVVSAFVKAILYTPQNMRILAIRNFVDLCEAPGMAEKFAFMMDEKERVTANSTTSARPLILLLTHISQNYNSPEHAKLRAAFEATTSSKAVMEQLGNGGSITSIDP